MGTNIIYCWTNATGKTQFAEVLKDIFKANGLRVRYLSAERLTGQERQTYHYYSRGSQIDRGLDIGDFQNYKTFGEQYGLSADSWIVLNNKIDVKVRIEAFLSRFFKRQIRLSEQGGFLSPKIQKQDGGQEYGLKENECHGLKELIGLLAFIYDDDYNCLIMDEPELHLHPQFQQFILQEIKKIAGNPLEQQDKKMFVIITHSPFMLDINTLENFQSLIVFQPGFLPAWVRELDSDDIHRIRRILPRLNTHHKQFFFSNRPIFVEGYTDQQLFKLILEVRGQNIGAGGVSIIDVGGKDDVDAFYRLSERINIKAYAIVDFDVIFESKLRQTVNQNNDVKEYLQKEGLDKDLLTIIGQMSSILIQSLRP